MKFSNAFLLSHLANSAEGEYQRPHVLFILADDLGWDDVGWVNEKVNTPVLDQMRENSIELEQYYVHQVCTPSRAALMTGRYPIRYGMQRGVIKPDEPEGVPLREQLLPRGFKQCGYSTLMSGKWHLGLYTKAHLPQNRGFDRFFGFYLGSQDFYFHRTGFKTDRSFWAESATQEELENFKSVRTKLPAGYDFREAYSTGEEIIRHDAWGHYSTTLLVNDAIEQLKNRDPRSPLFHYLSIQDPHVPNQRPLRLEESIEQFNLGKTRSVFVTKVKSMDLEIGRYLEALKETGHYNNTIIIFSSDNGGARKKGASNWPLRGGKGSIFDGAFRSRALVHIPGLEYRKYPHMFHAVDWMPTLMELLNCDLPKAHLPLDGVSHMEALLKITDRTPREELLLDIDPGADVEILIEQRVTDTRDFSYLNEHGFDCRMRAALRYKEWKIITGPPCSGPRCGVQTTERNYLGPEEFVPNNRSVRLYNITADLREAFDLSDEYPEVTKALLMKLCEYHQQQSLFVDREGSLDAHPETSEHAWKPWRDTEIDDLAHQEYMKRVLAA